ncbi:MAG: cysteine hydrolase [Deltaproteobacteria bacterium]|nr:cysteine hydrolase [Deltaproteobacteria bacterium]MCL5277168.1 cysteine hydrolase [Deltaproteobacteria bacterium]
MFGPTGQQNDQKERIFDDTKEVIAVKTFHNKVIYDTLGEIVAPGHTAMVVWDVQNALVNSIFNKQEFLSSLKTIIGKAREKGVPVLYSKITPLPPQYNSSWAIYSTMRRYGVDDPAKLPPFMKPGTPDAEIASEVAPAGDDLVIPKHTASFFIGTHVEYMLRNKGIETVVFSGIATEFGVESSARDASNRGFYPVVVSDCVSSMDKGMHEIALKVLARMAITAQSADIIKAWKQAVT